MFKWSCFLQWKLLNTFSLHHPHLYNIINFFCISSRAVLIKECINANHTLNYSHYIAKRPVGGAKQPQMAYVAQLVFSMRSISNKIVLQCVESYDALQFVTSKFLVHHSFQWVTANKKRCCWADMFFVCFLGFLFSFFALKIFFKCFYSDASVIYRKWQKKLNTWPEVFS